jgi:hypothetical protein
MNADARDNPQPDVAHALLRAVSRLVSTPRLLHESADGVLPMTRTNADEQSVLNPRSSAFIGGHPFLSEPL